MGSVSFSSPGYFIVSPNHDDYSQVTTMLTESIFSNTMQIYIRFGAS